jgi:hypothetical protein
MPDIAVISAALTSLKAATEIAKILREGDLSLEKAELKLKLADLISALADTKIKLAEVQEVIIGKDNRIAELEEAFEIKGTLKRENDAYYVVDAEGNPVGAPYCLRCWETDHRKRQLVQHSRHATICTSCGHKYKAYMTNAISRNS